MSRSDDETKTRHDDDEKSSTEETPWTDNAIREFGNADVDNGPAEPDYYDPFADPDPTQEFVFEFDHNTSNNHIRVSLTGYKKDADEIYTSTGLTLWRAAEHLCRYMVEHSARIFTQKNQRVLELGAGLGLVGLVADQLLVEEKSSLFVTDGDTDALQHLRTNVADRPRVRTHQLLWGRATTERFLKDTADDEPFDLLLASDVVYVSSIVVPLWETVQTLLRKTGMFIFAYCSRRHVPVSIDYVLEQAAKFEFQHELVEDREGVLIYIFRWIKDPPNEVL